MNIKPLHDRIVVRAEKQEARTESGIIIADANFEKPVRGEVLAVGPGTLKLNGERGRMTVQAGDKILFSKHTPYSTIKLDGEELLVMREVEIFAIIK